MPSVAIVGTEGSGKTVLITALAKMYGRASGDQLFLNPMNRKTASYVEQAWQSLSNFEWPPSTRPGDVVELHWRMFLDEELQCDLKLCDSAGQDLRLLFADDFDVVSAGLPQSLRELAEYVRSADVVVFLVNLRDFAGEGDPDRRLGNEWTLRGAMDYLANSQCPRRWCLTFTQEDQYRQYLETHKTWQAVAETYLPHVYGSYVHNGNGPVFAISAVGSTRIVNDERGRPRRVPDRDSGVRCRGFKPLVQWLVVSLNQAINESGTPLLPHTPQENAGNSQVPIAMAPIPTTDDDAAWHAKWWESIASIAILAFFIGLILLGYRFFNPLFPYDYKVTQVWGPIWGDYAKVEGNVKNNTSKSSVTVTVTFKEKGKDKTGSQFLYARPGERARFAIDVNVDDLKSAKGPWFDFK